MTTFDKAIQLVKALEGLMESEGDEIPAALSSFAELEKNWEQQVANRKQAASDRQNNVKKPEGDEVSREHLASIEKSLQTLSSQVESLSAEINRAIGTISNQGDLYVRFVTAEEDFAQAQEA